MTRHLWVRRKCAGRGVIAPLLLLVASLGCQAALQTTAPVSDPPQPGNLAALSWQKPYALMPRATFEGPQVQIDHIRNFYYFREDIFVPRYYSKTFRLQDVRAIDFVVVPFREAPSLAHTMLSFELADGDFLGVSVEARMREGQSYSPLWGAMGRYELMYVVADERDLVQLRTEHRDVEVRIYRTKVTPQEAQTLLVDMLHRMNRLAEQPELYHTLTNNCTTNIVQHVNRLRPGQIPYSVGVLLPGHSDRLAYDLGLLDGEVSFAELREAARVNERARRYRDQAAFSTLIRR
jgi:hypothetical protein